MVGERYSHSLDISEELKKEEEEKKQQLSCTCSPDLNKKGQSAEPSKEKAEEGAEAQSAAETENVVADKSPEPTEEEKAEEKSGSDKTASPEQKEGAEAPNQSFEEETQTDEVGAGVTKLPIDDPVEEDINAIITKDIPELPPKKTLWSTKRVVGLVLVGLVIGVFFFWMRYVPEEAVPEASSSLVSLVVYNMTGAVQETMPLSEPVLVGENKSVSEPVLPAAEQSGMPRIKSLDELPDFLSERLKD